jgi:hypothetical protein
LSIRFQTRAKPLRMLWLRWIRWKWTVVDEFGKRGRKLSPAHSASNSKAGDDGSARIGPHGPRPH